MDTNTFYLILVVVLAILAASDLIVGVTNDAVNFLNSAIGSKAASMKAIMAIAAFGVLFGATFSSGMMEVARKGIFHPELFSFSNIMIIFLAVMVTDIILLDVFNTFGLPTSTTVSIVFELLGAALAIAYIRTSIDAGTDGVLDYINTKKAFEIISGILLSVVVAFTAGAFFQYITRLLFSFDIKKANKFVSAIWGGFSIAAISFFILIKGAKSASFMTADIKAYIHDNTFMLVIVFFIFWTLLFFILNLFTRFNILRFIVLVGTFSLAMAFAGNDLVNFIGVPLAGFASYSTFVASGSADPNTLMMAALAGKVPTPLLLLLLAGVIMMVTLFFSKKARSVVKTSLDLSRQDSGDERFRSSAIARSLVRGSIKMGKVLESIIPAVIVRRIERRFDETPFKHEQKILGKKAPTFDMARAAGTLVVSSILISIGTAMKLPLSTTYVTFMVAMGTSFADGAWGRESAVYRISGVMSVVGGWFMTAISASVVAASIAFAFYYGGAFAMFTIIVLAGYMMFHTHKLHTSKTEEAAFDEAAEQGEKLTTATIINKGIEKIEYSFMQVLSISDRVIEGLQMEDMQKLKVVNKDFDRFNRRTKKWKDNVNVAIENMDEETLEVMHNYVQVLDYLRELAHSSSHLVRPSKEHTANKHKPFTDVQIEELYGLNAEVKAYFLKILSLIKKGEITEADGEEVTDYQTKLLKSVKKTIKNQVKRIKEGTVGTRNTLLYFDLLSEYKNLTLFGLNLFKSQRDMILISEDDEE